MLFRNSLTITLIAAALNFVSVAHATSVSAIEQKITGTFANTTADCNVILPGVGELNTPIGTRITIQATDTVVHVSIAGHTIDLPVNPPPSSTDPEVTLEGEYGQFGHGPGYSYSKHVESLQGDSFESINFQILGFGQILIQSGLNSSFGYNYCTFK